MTETLWTPWRMDYILGPKSGGCVFCEALADGAEHHTENLILHVAEHAFVIMNRYPYSHAHIMILPKRHVSMLDDLSREEHQGLFDLVMDAQSIIWRALEPQGMNLGINLGKAAGAGIDDHVHIHVVPRWNGDTNFMPILADVRTMPEHLSDTYVSLSQFFNKIGKSG